MPAIKHEFRDPAVLAALQKIEACGLSLKRMPSSVKIFAQNGMLLIDLSSKAQILHFVRELGDAPPQSPPDDGVLRIIDDLQTDLAIEREQHKILQSRLATLEQQLQSALTVNAAETRRYVRLKTIIAKEFHPDHFRGPAAEKSYRTEVFKLIWARIEDIDRS
jgi:hypothetical protein